MDFHDLVQALPDSVNLATPVLHIADGSHGQDGGAIVNDFQGGAPVPACPFPCLKKDEAGPSSAKGSVTIEMDFDNFFEASSNSAKGLGVHNKGTDLDDFFQTPIKSEDRGQGQHAQPSILDIQGQTMEPDFDDFFQAAYNSTNHFHRHKVKTIPTNTVEESMGQNGGTQLQDFFKGAPRLISQSNGHDKAEHVDFFQAASPSVKESSGKIVSTGFYGLFAGVPNSAEKSLGQSETKALVNNGGSTFARGVFMTLSLLAKIAGSRGRRRRWKSF